MSSEFASFALPTGSEDPLEAARADALERGLPYAGCVTPPVAWALIRDGDALLVDVRTAEERKLVGRVPDSLAVCWATGIDMAPNPRFLRELEAEVASTVAERTAVAEKAAVEKAAVEKAEVAGTGGKDVVLLMLCRSGKRSALAAEAAAGAGFGQVYNVLEGFEGDLDAAQQRGHLGGWRFHGLPWVQD